MDTDDGEKYDREGENSREMSRETDETDERKSEREGIQVLSFLLDLMDVIILSKTFC